MIFKEHLPSSKVIWHMPLSWLSNFTKASQIIKDSEFSIQGIYIDIQKKDIDFIKKIRHFLREHSSFISLILRPVDDITSEEVSTLSDYTVISVDSLSLSTSDNLPKNCLFLLKSFVPLSDLETLLQKGDGFILNRKAIDLSDSFKKSLSFIPYYQKEITELCKKHHKVCLVQSDIMDSMSIQGTPTRAEVSDVSLMVSQGVDGLILDQKVVDGPYLQGATSVIIDTVLASPKHIFRNIPLTDASSVALAACNMASIIKIHAIVCDTLDMAYHLASLNSPVPVFVLTKDQDTAQKLSILNSIFPFISHDSSHPLSISKTKELLKDSYAHSSEFSFILLSYDSSQYSLSFEKINS